ncbi:YicC family protein [Entomomonas moraniae]|uniref:YicC family protein n=1 Tax=Entomomonas moraniae TaxID=2213226 RepID=A0A3S9XGJ8_9GAMM|nr:YicC/YloC family endoribonuclease [Entomomonas moraniae]AZS51436.1 YicC family protein [Entomomonas moraniae]
MLQSMTAFARCELSIDEGILCWEIRSVNHRYLEHNFKLPETFRSLEWPLRDKIKKELSRGKVECTLTFSPQIKNNPIQINLELSKQLIQAAEQISELTINPTPINPFTVLSWSGVLITDQINHELLQEKALALFAQALQELKQNRNREGKELQTLLEERLVSIDMEVNKLRPLIPEMLDNQRQKIITRCQELAVSIDPQRLEQELVLLAQKSDVAEELDRLQTHLTEVRHTFTNKEPCGRRLDFLMQELNREANTLGSKAIDVRTTQAAVNIKVLIEQMREQVQNIE